METPESKRRAGPGLPAPKSGERVLHGLCWGPREMHGSILYTPSPRKILLGAKYVSRPDLSTLHALSFCSLGDRGW